MFSFPYGEFELVSKKMKQIAAYGKGKNARKPIKWRMTETDGIKHITAYQLGGAMIHLMVVPSVNNLHELADFGHEGKFQQSVDLLATILEHKGAYERIAA